MTDRSSETKKPSFAELMAGHQVRLIGYIRSLLADEHAAKDVLQETNMTLLSKQSDFELGTNFTAWSFRIAYFEVLSWRRDKGRDRLQFSDELVEAMAHTSETNNEQFDQRLEALKSCLKKLPDRQKNIVQKHYLNGDSVQEVAESMDLKPNAASQLLHRARRNLFQCINNVTHKHGN